MSQPLSSGWTTSEFWVTLAAMASKVVVLVYVIRNISATNPADPNALTQAITEVVLAVGAFVSIAFGSSNFTNRRTDLKVEAVKAAAHPTIITRP